MWKKIICSKNDLELVYTLTGGQCFRWKKTGKKQWTGVFSHKVWILSQTEDHILYKVFEDGAGGDLSSPFDPEAELRRYFRLDDFNLTSLYNLWSLSDSHFCKASKMFSGVRMLDQDPVENLFSFICSSANNIPRITKMVDSLCSMYGKKLLQLNGVTYYDFPTIDVLAHEGVEPALRTASFGFRAKSIANSAISIQKLGGVNWLFNLRTLPYAEAKAELLKLPGIGTKVADCICLMSLGHLEAVPVDTHVFHVAVANYLPHLKKHKNISEKIRLEISDHFCKMYGEYAGWAQTVLFCSDLKAFQESKNVLRKRILKEANPKKKKKKIGS